MEETYKETITTTTTTIIKGQQTYDIEIKIMVGIWCALDVSHVARAPHTTHTHTQQ